MVVDEVVDQGLDPVEVALEGEEDEKHLEVLPVGHHVVVVELLASVFALPLLDDLEQGAIKCGPQDCKSRTKKRLAEASIKRRLLLQLFLLIG